MHLYLIQLLRAALHGKPPAAPPEDLDWRQLYTQADFHSVACTAYYGLLMLPEEQQPQPEVLGLFRKAAQIVLGRETMQQYEVQHIMEKLDSKGIPYLPLKGWKMKRLYPRPDMRSMCDVDILIRQEDMPEFPTIMKESGFELEYHGMHHDEYIKNATLSIEIHRLLFEPDSDWYEYFKQYMERTSVLDSKRQERQLPQEDFYLYLIAHMAKHFRNGGTGVRSVMDVYVYQKAYGDSLDTAYVQREFEKLGLGGFARAMEELAQSWFAGEQIRSDCHPKMADYILNGGTYGLKDRGILSSVHEAGNHKGKYLLRRFFPNRHFMAAQYPCIEKAPVLLPFFWGVRAFRTVFFRRESFKREMQTVYERDGEKREQIEEIWKDSGLSQ